MSISDMIIVMKDGALNQVGKPQEVYDDPTNLFVAKFLGTPPINVFDGEVREGKLYIGENAVLDVPGVEDQPVYAAIRPEGFVLDENGPFICKLSGVEVMGRDYSVLSDNDACHSNPIRAIISTDHKVNTDTEVVRFSLKPHKVHLFHKDTEVRIRVK